MDNSYYLTKVKKEKSVNAARKSILKFVRWQSLVSESVESLPLSRQFRLSSLSERNTNINKYFKLRKAMFSIFHNISQLNFAVLLIIKPVFHLATLFAQREAKTSIRQHDWLKLVGEKIRREQVGTVPTFLSVRANKVAKWKIGLRFSF